MDGEAWEATVCGVTKSQTLLSNFTFTFHFHALEKEMATHSSVLAWRIPGTEEPGGLLPMGSHRVRHDWSNLAAAAVVLQCCVSFLLYSKVNQLYVYTYPIHLLLFSWSPCISSVQFSFSVMSNSLWPHGLQHTRLPCPSPTPKVCSNSCALSRWYHPTISSSVVLFSSCLLSFLASGSFQMSQFFASGHQSIGV